MAYFGSCLAHNFNVALNSLGQCNVCNNTACKSVDPSDASRYCTLATGHDDFHANHGNAWSDDMPELPQWRVTFRIPTGRKDVPWKLVVKYYQCVTASTALWLAKKDYPEARYFRTPEKY